MKNIFVKSLLLSLALFASVSCGNKQLPQGVLDESTMVELLCDVYTIEGYFVNQTDFKTFLLPAEAVSAYSDLMEKYNINDSVFEASFKYYMEDNERFEAINTQVVQQLSQRAESR